jgi:hypothetical protein
VVELPCGCAEAVTLLQASLVRGLQMDISHRVAVRRRLCFSSLVCGCVEAVTLLQALWFGGYQLILRILAMPKASKYCFLSHLDDSHAAEADTLRKQSSTYETLSISALKKRAQLKDQCEAYAEDQHNIIPGSKMWEHPKLTGMYHTARL